MANACEARVLDPRLARPSVIAARARTEALACPTLYCVARACGSDASIAVAFSR
jgi:hypothetical protein